MTRQAKQSDSPTGVDRGTYANRQSIADRRERDRMQALAVKVVIRRQDGEETVLGTFNQGVVFESGSLLNIGQVFLKDVATGDVIATYKGDRWYTESRRFDLGRLFVQGIAGSS